MVVLAVKGTAAVDSIKLADVVNLKGKTVIDATNPIAYLPPYKGVLKFFTNLDNSMHEMLTLK